MGMATKKLTLFSAELEKDIFSPGETLKGKVVVELAEDMKMGGIHIEFAGYASVMFDEYIDSAGRKTYSNASFMAREDYYKMAYILFGNDKGQTTSDIPVLGAGRHEYPFEFTLPGATPPSAEFKQGYIRHQVIASIEEPWETDHVLRKRFTVRGHHELTDKCLSPFSQAEKQVFGMSCCPSGSITIDVKLPRTGYVPGEYIMFKGILRNQSSRPVKAYILRLQQNVIYHGALPNSVHPHAQSHYTINTVGEIRREKGIQANQTVNLAREALLVPPLPASFLEGCNIIHCDYHLEVAMVQSTFETLRIEIPLKIGTVPPNDVAAVYCRELYNPDWYNKEVTGEFPPPSTFEPVPVEIPPQPIHLQVIGEKASHDEDADEDRGKVNHNPAVWGPSYPYYLST